MVSKDKSFSSNIDTLKKNLLSMKSGGNRIIIAIAGAPASGKSTFAESLVTSLNEASSNSATLLPMDGFHLDNIQLESQDLLSRKGAPETFDVRGFEAILSVMRDRTTSIYYPTFDRSKDIAIAGKGVILPENEIVVVEGNYLLLDQNPWSKLSNYFDFKLFIEVPIETLKIRLVNRWLDNGYDQEGALLRANSNDILNARLVINHQIQANHILTQIKEDVE